jgi:uncharacterized membrane protein YbaN (DUF454 family)
LSARALFTVIVISSAFDTEVFSFSPSWVWLHGSLHLSSVLSGRRSTMLVTAKYTDHGAIPTSDKIVIPLRPSIGGVLLFELVA